MAKKTLNEEFRIVNDFWSMRNLVKEYLILINYNCKKRI